MADDGEEKAGTEVESRVGLSVIAHPLANEKLRGKIMKLVRKAAKEKCIRRGVKEVVKSFKKKEKGIMVIAGNITPIDVISHIPILCEENDIPYVYVPAKEELGAASSTKRPTSVIHVLPKKDAEFMESFEKVKKSVQKVQPNQE